MAKRLLVLVIWLTLVMFLAAGCKSSSTTAAGGGVPATSTASASAAPTACPSEASGFAKTKFVAHAALGFGAFHRYICKPYRAGTFRSGAHGRLVAFIKAGLAALFIKREIRLAFAAAQNSPALCKLVVSPMRTVSETVQAAVSTAAQSGIGTGLGGHGADPRGGDAEALAARGAGDAGASRRAQERADAGCRAVGEGGRAGPRVPEALPAGAGLVPAGDIHGHRPGGRDRLAVDLG